MFDSKNFIGKTEYNEIVTQSVENGIIKGFNQYVVTELHDGTEVLNCIAWTHSVTIGNKEIKSGQSALKSKKLPKKLENLYECGTISCEECGEQFDSESDNSEFTVTDCSVVCKECVTAEQLLIEVKNPSDIFHSKNIESVNTEGFEEVETLFCDSSGLGGKYEHALTKNEAMSKVEELMNSSNETLYSGLSGVGQFQVYVTIYKKSVPKNWLEKLI